MEIHSPGYTQTDQSLDLFLGFERKKMKVYIAGPFELKENCIHLAKILEYRGIECTSTWFASQSHELCNPDHIEEMRANDLADIRISDLIILLNPGEWKHRGTGGRHFETGYAHHLGKRIIILGEKTNIFHHGPNIELINFMDLAFDFEILPNMIKDMLA